MSDDHQPQTETDALDDEIRTAAYFKWLAAGRPDGRHLEFWCAAEQEFAGLRQIASPTSSDGRPASHHELAVRPKALPAPEKRTAARSKPAASRPAAR